MRAAKLRKDGIPKRSGLREGDRRVARTLAFKLQVVDEFRRLQQRKEAGQCTSPLQAVARRFGVNKSLVSKWAAGETRIRSAATQANRSRLLGFTRVLGGRSLTGSPARAARAGCAVEQGGRERASSGGDRDMQNARRSTQLSHIYQSSHTEWAPCQATKTLL